VDASSTTAGLRFALRSLAPGGHCTAVGFYFGKRTGLPLMQMYANSTTLHVGVSHPRRDLPDVIELVRQGIFDPLKVATLITDWDEAPDAFMTRTTKVLVARPPYGQIARTRDAPQAKAS
jgi:alcohol dehydrogenase